MIIGIIQLDHSRILANIVVLSLGNKSLGKSHLHKEIVEYLDKILLIRMMAEMSASS